MDKTLRPVAYATFAYLAVATPYAVAVNNVEFLFYIGVVLAIGGIVAVIHRRVGFSRGLLWALSAWGLLHMLGGLARVPTELTDNGSGYLYSLWLIPELLKYDQVVHAYGFAASTVACWQCIRTVPGIKASFGVLTLCAFGGMGLGALNEIIEFAAVLLIPGTNVGGYENTGWDLVANAIGSFTAAFFIGRWHGKKK